MRRCTYGIPWISSAQVIAQGQVVVLAVQPLESWRELWIFHKRAGTWIVDVLPPGLNDPEEGYIEYAGYVPATKRLLIAREVKERGRFRRSFEELRLDDLTTVKSASSPDLLRDFGRWQDPAWRRDTLGAALKQRNRNAKHLFRVRFGMLRLRGDRGCSVRACRQPRASNSHRQS